MVNALGDSMGEKELGNLQVLRKVIVKSGNRADYVNEIQVSQKLGYPAYWKALRLLYLRMRIRVFLLGSSSSTYIQANSKSYNENALQCILERR